MLTPGYLGRRGREFVKFALSGVSSSGGCRFSSLTLLFSVKLIFFAKMDH